MQASLCILRGKCFHGLENRPRASFWLKRALTIDALASEAFEMLVDNYMLTTDEEGELLSQINFGSDRWLFDVYTSRLKKVHSFLCEESACVRVCVRMCAEPLTLARSV